MNPSTPKLFGQVKLHKEEQTMRPVVAYYTDPSFKLAQFLLSWFHAFSNFNPCYTIKNSVELSNKLKDRKFPVGARLISFDVKSIFFQGSGC